MVVWSGWCPAISNQIMCYSNGIQTKMLTQREITMSVENTVQRRRPLQFYSHDTAAITKGFLDDSFGKTKHFGYTKHANSYIYSSIRATVY